MLSSINDSAYDVLNSTSINLDNHLMSCTEFLNNSVYIKAVYNITISQQNKNIYYKKDIQSILNQMYHSVTGIDAIVFTDTAENTFCLGNVSQNSVETVARQLKEFESTSAQMTLWKFFDEKNNSGRIVMYKKMIYISDDYKMYNLGSAAVFLNEPAAQKTVSKLKGDYTGFLITDSSGTVVMSETAGEAGKRFDELYKSSNGMLHKGSETFSTIEMTSELTKWKYMCITSKSRVSEDFRSTTHSITPVIAFALILTVAIVIISTNKLTSPLVSLSKQMEEISGGSCKRLEIVSKNREIDVVNSAFNKMVENLENQINMNFVLNLKMKDALIKSYQNQMNPHFLFNTLQLIQSMSAAGENRSVIKASAYLGEILRFNLYGQNEVLIREEMDNVINYLKLTKLRFGEKFEYEISVSPEIEDFYTMKFLIQPIAENAVIHGLSHSDKNGKVRLVAKAVNNEIAIIIGDNGRGIKQEELAALKASLKNCPAPSEDIGLLNVQQRLKLYYGKKYGIEVYSKYGEYTNVLIHIPICTEKTSNEKGAKFNV